MHWLVAPAVAVVAVALGVAPAGAVVTNPLQGVVESVGAGVSGIAVGNTLSGSVTYDETGAFCPGACPVTDVSLHLPSAVSLGFDDRAGLLSVNVTALPALPGSLDGSFDVPGAPYGVSGGILFAGILSGLGAGHFELFGDPAASTFIASGTLLAAVVPVPAALPLLATALGAVAAIGRRPRPPRAPPA